MSPDPWSAFPSPIEAGRHTRTRPNVYTVGHSTRTLDGLLALIVRHGVRLLVDVRRFPVSRRHPHFRREALEAALGRSSIEYRHEPDLGGHRTPRPDSPHTAWRTAAFRGYADHMETAEFREALARVVGWSRSRATAVMCAEAVPWRCHRQLLADALVVAGLTVRHLLDAGLAEDHALHPRARVTADGRLHYGGPRPRQAPLFPEG